MVLVVSTGPPIIALPDVRNQPQTDATTALTKAGFKVGTVTQEYSDTIDDGKVISQDPAGPSQQRKGTTINLVVSKGPEYVTLPKVSGKSGEKAKKELEDAGMTVVVNSVYGGALDITVGLSVDKADTNDSGQVRKGSHGHHRRRLIGGLPDAESATPARPGKRRTGRRTGCRSWRRSSRATGRSCPADHP